MERPPADSNVLEVLRLIAGRKSFYAKKGEASAEIEAIQKALIGLGFRLVADGMFGPQTVAALRRLQEGLDLKQSGTPNVETVNRLLNVLQDPGLQEELKEKIARLASARKPPPDGEDKKKPAEKVLSGAVLPQTISDGAVTDIGQDALGFADYVRGLQMFLSAQETRPPLAIGITARWGQGKTSFMRMLESELEKRQRGSTKFVTSWFNPWLYSEPEQLWNAFVSNLSSCILHALPRKNRRRFHRQRFWLNLKSRVGFGPRFWLGLLTILLTVAIFAYGCISPIGEKAMLDITAKYIGTETKKALEAQPALPLLLSVLGATFLASIFYHRVVKKFDLGLIDYLQQQDYAVKVGALVQFQDEMEMLAKAVPDDLRVVMFIDDLDRCDEKILMEVISSLQVLTVSSRCFFVLGLDLAIVARQIEGSVLAQALEQTDENQHVFQHGSGFRFLEKVIQARLSVPPYGREQITGMIKNLLPKTTGAGEKVETAGGPQIGPSPESAIDSKIVAQPDAEKAAEQVVDSPEIGAALTKYGPVYFDNPRSLKRFMNSFRMHAHLATMVDNKVSIDQLDQLARYFVLAECWPGLLDYFYRHPDRLSADGVFVAGKRSGTGPHIEDQIEILMSGKAGDLFTGGAPLGGETIAQLCRWYGFRFYRANRYLNP